MMSYETETYTGILREILGELERSLPFGNPKTITFTRIRMQLDNGKNYDTITLNPISEEYKNRSITLEEKVKIKKDGTCILKERLSSEKLNLVTSVRYKENRIIF